ncbi:MAG: hypothetical protein MJZ26_10970 [Fibrobacter sp.]|nr:hypothetical protein [Fibrobacter sp.]
MREFKFLAIFLGLAALLSLESCSRESSVKENVNLKNNHSRVFAQREAFEDPQAFADSIANTAVDKADTIPDTLTVTVNDTIYLMGILPRNVDKIYRFQWNLTKSDGKDTVIIGDNIKPQAWKYAKPGVYYPKFIAFDGNNATDTAGTDTKRAYIRVIDTKPQLNVPKDTLWTSHDGNITFPITVSDSFGSIASIKVDLDASGKEAAQKWKYETREGNDSLYLTIKNDSSKIDSLGNQKIYVIVKDDDDNEVTDSVNLHFNRIPKLKILYPQDGARHNIADRFYFYYEAEDADNPQNLQYFIYAQVSPNGQPPQKAFTPEDLIAAEFTSNIFEPITSDGRNVITLLNDPSKELTGRIYWDMYVFDGYDITHMERIKVSDGVSRHWSFYIGDIKSSKGKFTGVAKYQGRDNHSGIRVEFNDGNKIYDGMTDAKGNYTIQVDPGAFTVKAHSDSLKEFGSATQKDLYIESGITVKVKELVLKDTASPLLLVKNLDTLSIRDFVQTIYARDLGAYVSSVTGSIDGAEQKIGCSASADSAVFNCSMPLKDKSSNPLTDGSHKLEYSATDKAGNKTSLKQDIFIKATTLTLNVNGVQKHKIGSAGKLEFNAVVGNAYPAADSVTWNWKLDGAAITKKTKVEEDGSTKLVLEYKDVSSADPDIDYLMTASYKKNGADLSAQVKFGILGDNPAIIFTEPGFQNTVTLNDPLHFEVVTFMGVESSELTVSWNCGTNLSEGYTCPTTEQSGDLAFNKFGEHLVVVTVTDDKGFKNSDTVTVNVISDPPSIKASTGEKASAYKINSKVQVSLDASDKYGTVNMFKWACDNGNLFDFTNDTTITPAKSVSDLKITITLPGQETNKYRCIFKAIDDDKEESSDTLTFATLLDIPTIRLATKTDTVKINSNVKIKAIANDELGYITQYDIACDESLSSLKNPDWTVMPGAETTVRMPSTAMDKYYCVVRVTDDDGNTAKDTALYKTVVGRPTVTASINHKTVTIKDEVELNAHAQDSLGSIVKYEWGCGAAEATNIGFTYSSATTPKTTMVMPSTAMDKYLCIIRVTDDDGNTAKDTVETKVIVAPPTIEVVNKSLIIREGYNITLNARASDNNNLPSDPGEIVKREWSCGKPEQIEANWKTVASFDTVWKAPAPQADFICIARATDNDGNQAADTMTFTFSTDLPIIWVKDELVYLNKGDNFVLGATVNDVWQGINWFSWECINKATGKTLESSVPKYSYKENGKSFTVPKDSSYTLKGVDMYCIVSAEEASTRATFKDTTEIRIMEQHPEGVISAADTVYLWSGDESVDDEALYFYSKDWNGSSSKLGELGDKNNQDFWWKFSNVKNTFYQGNPDGSLDTSIAEFNSAFIRSNFEGEMTITLDYRDSTTTSPSYGFYSRHRANEVSRKVYFRKAWQNLAKDTVLKTTASNTAPAQVIVNGNPVIAYMADATTLNVAVMKSGKWTTLEKSTADSVTAIKIATNGTDLFFGLLTAKNDLHIFKSAGASSALAGLGTISDVWTARLLCNPTSKEPVVVYNTKTDKLNFIAVQNGDSWKSSATARKNDTVRNPQTGKDETRPRKFREIEAAFSENGKLVIVTVDTTANYSAYCTILSNDYSSASKMSQIANDFSGINLVAGNGKIYMGFLNRNVEKYGPYVYEGTVGTNEVSWNTSGIFGSALFEGYIAYHISLAVHNGIVYAAIDDNGYPTLSQVHVFRLEGKKWHFHGENQLPYFNTVFYYKHNYFLRGHAPQLAIDGEGKVYLSMLARENAGGSGNNNGPIIMKYVADSWEIH